MNHFESPTPKDDSCQVWLKSNHAFSQEVEICMVLALGGPPPGPHEGHMYHMNNFESLAPRDDSCQVWLKSDHAFPRRKWNSYFLQRAPSPTCYPPQGPIGATLGTAMNNFYSSPNKVSTHYITWLFSVWIWRRRCLKFAWFWPFGALPPGPHGGHTYYLNNSESLTPKDDSCQVSLKSNHAFSRRRWRCKKFTDDARWTTQDGRKRTAIAHLSLRLRWAKKTSIMRVLFL